MQEHAVLVGCGDDLFDNAIPMPRVRIRDTVAQGVRGQAFVGIVQVALVAKEGPSVRD